MTECGYRRMFRQCMSRDLNGSDMVQKVFLTFLMVFAFTFFAYPIAIMCRRSDNPGRLYRYGVVGLFSTCLLSFLGMIVCALIMIWN